MNYSKRVPSKRLMALSLALVVGLAAVLRFTGLQWGIPTPDLPHQPFHPDEEWVMNVMAQVNPGNGDWNPEAGHREGTLSFFAWTGAAIALRMAGILQALPHSMVPFQADYATLIYVSRVLVACTDILTILLVFFTLRLISSSVLAPLIGAAALAVTPFEVIHAHYMRAHVIANFFITATAYFSFRFLLSERRGSLFLAGVCCGLATATRYPSLAIIALPVLHTLSKHNFWTNLRQRNWRNLLQSLWSRAWIVLGTGLLIGFFVGAPFLLLDFDTAQPHLTEQAQYAVTSQFSIGELFNLSVMCLGIRRRRRATTDSARRADKAWPR